MGSIRKYSNLVRLLELYNKHYFYGKEFYEPIEVQMDRPK